MKERATVQTSLLGIAKKARSDKRYRFRNLYRELNEELLLDSWRLLRKDAALGADRVSAAEYEANLEENIHQLVERLKRKSYRAKLVRRHYIPKSDGGKRPLGIPATEDKLLQLAVKRLLEAIYEQDFLSCSYGYRPLVGALEAVDQLTVKLQFGAYHQIVEADIRGFFDNLSHEWLMRMLAERIDDEPILRLIKKWLKAGVLDTDGKVLRPEGGTPQGGIISPLLANVYLHYALDLWFDRVFQRSSKGNAFLHRYADDFVCGFEKEEEALKQFSKVFPSGFLLVDTYDSIAAVKKIIRLGIHTNGIRLDSGDLEHISTESRRLLDNAGYTGTKIMATGDLNEYIIRDLVDISANIETLTAQNTKIDLGKDYSINCVAIDMHQAGLPFDHFPLTCQFVQRNSTMLFRRDHWRYLVKIPPELFKCSANLIFV